MPVQVSYPGVYIEEIPSGVRTITGVATSITAFIGRAKRGPVNEPITINSFGDFERVFGGMWQESKLGFSVRDYFLNGGGQAIIVRLYNPVAIDPKIKAMADSIKAAGTGAAAKVAAGAANTAIQNDAANTLAVKTAAEIVLEEVQTLADNANAVNITKAVDDAITKATPSSRAVFSVGELTLQAKYEGKWGANLGGAIDQDNISSSDSDRLFNLTIRDNTPGGITERFLNLSAAENQSRFVKDILNQQSRLVAVNGAVALDVTAIKKAITEFKSAKDDPAKEKVFWKATLDQTENANKLLKQALKQEEKANKAVTDAGAMVPPATQTSANDAQKAVKAANEALAKAKPNVSDGQNLSETQFTSGEGTKEGLFALEKADLFNLLCIPPYTETDVSETVIESAISYCKKRRAMLLIDAPSTWNSKDAAKTGFDTGIGAPDENAAIFFPRLRQPNPFKDGMMEDFVPCGAVAGLFARTDAQRGVWKAPAGTEAQLLGVPQFSIPLTDPEIGELNPKGINCLRALPPYGRIAWGARTRKGNDQFASEWKYIPVRRTALFIEESLYRALHWVVFEPNDEPLWASIRLNVGAFMNDLFRKGAFQGTSPKDAYFVRCDRDTNPQNDINNGIVNVLVGFAPLKPAEFVIIKLQQMAGQIEV